MPTRTVPNLVVRAMALFDPGIRSVVGGLGKTHRALVGEGESTLGWSPRPIEDTIAETGESLIEHGVIDAGPLRRAREGAGVRVLDVRGAVAELDGDVLLLAAR